MAKDKEVVKKKKNKKRSKGAMVVEVQFDDYEIIGCLGDYVVNRLDFETKYNKKAGTYNRTSTKERVVIESTFHCNLAQCLRKIVKDTATRLGKDEMAGVDELIKLVDYQNTVMDKFEKGISDAIKKHHEDRRAAKAL
jgi:hypothetical protein